MVFAESPFANNGDGPVADVLRDAERAAGAARRRVERMARDLFRTEDLHIDEARRTRMRAMLDGLVHAAEGRLRQDLARRLNGAVPAATLAALGDLAMPIARPVLESAGILADVDLVAALARRADEHRLVMQARIAAARDPDLIAAGQFAALLAHPDPAVAGAAALVSTLDAARSGPFDEPAIDATDLGQETQHRVIWRAAVAIRHWMERQPGGTDPVADRAVATSASIVLADLAMRPGLDDAALALARAMLRAGISDDRMIVALAHEGRIAVAVAGLALRAGIGMAAAWDMVLDPAGTPLVLLLRASGLARPMAASLLLRWPDGAASLERIDERVAGYDALSARAAHAAIDLHRMEPAYAAARHELDAGLARS